MLASAVRLASTTTTTTLPPTTVLVATVEADVSARLKDASDGVDYDTRESGGVAPELLLSVTP